MSSGFVIHFTLLLPLQAYTRWNSCSEVMLVIALIHSLCHELLSSISDGEDTPGLLATLVALAKSPYQTLGLKSRSLFCSSVLMVSFLATFFVYRSRIQQAAAFDPLTILSFYSISGSHKLNFVVELVS